MFARNQPFRYLALTRDYAKGDWTLDKGTLELNKQVLVT